MTKPGFSFLCLICVIASCVTGECLLLLCWVLVSSVLSKDIHWKECLKNDLFCVKWDAKLSNSKSVVYAWWASFIALTHPAHKNCATHPQRHVMVGPPTVIMALSWGCYRSTPRHRGRGPRWNQPTQVHLENSCEDGGGDVMVSASWMEALADIIMPALCGLQVLLKRWPLGQQALDIIRWMRSINAVIEFARCCKWEISISTQKQQQCQRNFFVSVWTQK